MNWKYFIPHKWEGETAEWEQVIIMPEKQNIKPFWITLSGMDSGELNPGMYFDDVLFLDVVFHLEEKEYYIKDNDIYLRKKRFNKNDLTKYTQRWLKNRGYKCEKIKEVTAEDLLPGNQLSF